MLDLMEKDLAILIRGNHEDLVISLLKSRSERSYLATHHQSNGTVDTVCQLTGSHIGDLYADAKASVSSLKTAHLFKRSFPP